MSIEIGPEVPVEHRKVLPTIARVLLKIFKWKVEGSVPNTSKMILIGAPHSSFSDLFYVLLTVYSLDVKASFLAATWTFNRLPFGKRVKGDQNSYGMRWPLGWLQDKFMRRVGGIPVDRSKSTGAIDKLANHIESMDKMVLMITPEGSTKGAGKIELKSGFYILSQRLNLPVVPIQFDYAKRRFKLLEAIYPSGDKDKDMDKIRDLFDGIEGKNRKFMA